MSLVNINKKDVFNKRAKNILNNSRKDFKDVGVDLTIEKAFAMSLDFSRTQLTFVKHAKTHPCIWYFLQDTARWNMLNYIIYFSAKKQVIYKEKLKKLIRASTKKTEKLIDDAINGGYFIYLDPHHKVLKNKKILNIRPSEELMKCFYKFNIDRFSRDMKIIKKHRFKCYSK